jgi:predicted DNA-binding protein with PD1-like motif
MKILIFISALLLFAANIKAQEKRTEVTKSTTSLDDTKANNDSIPDAYAIHGQFQQVMILRLKYQTDLLEGIEKIVKQENIRNAVILSAIGSVRNYHFHVVSNRTFPSRNIFVKNTDTPADIAGMNGYIIDGRVHAHITFSDPNKAFGGHLEPGTEVFTFAVITVGILNDNIDLKLVDDKTYR